MEDSLFPRAVRYGMKEGDRRKGGPALPALGAERVTAAEVPPQAVNDVGRYCTSCWRNARLPVDAWGDCTQEVFRRLLERVPASRWDLTLRADGDERREF